MRSIGARGRWAHAELRSGIKVFSGAGSHGVSAGGRAMQFSTARVSRSAVHDGMVSYSGEAAAPRHVTIGFPPDADARISPSARRSGAPLRFAGQGHSIWQQTSPRDAPNRVSAGGESRNSRVREWQSPEQLGDRGDRSGRNRDHFHGRFRRRFYSYARYRFVGYPWFFLGYGGYGLGYWPNCDQPLAANSDLDWQWQYDDNCENLAPQDDSIVAYGADPSYAAPQADTEQIYGPYVEQNPASGNANAADAKDAARAQPAQSETGQPARSSGPQSSATPDTLLYLADGSNYAVISYWIAGGELHYTTSYGSDDSVPFGQIDLQRTVDANAARGVPFTLRPSPRVDSNSAR
ncbi:MAG: hypothetical protein ACRD4R_00910 [Candidatus Acidiferrales bacterium]